MSSRAQEGRLAFRWYIAGFVLSLILTLGAYIIVDQKLMPRTPTLVWIVTLAILQAFIQLVCFLHLGRETKNHWNLIFFIFMALVALVVIFGSLWIMYSLNYRMMT
jgi:cytochrome o ubiquinol oxidase operon protein cyoD